MSKKNNPEIKKKKENKKKKIEEPKSYTSPLNKRWGKILIGFICVCLVLAVLATVVYFIYSTLTTV